MTTSSKTNNMNEDLKKEWSKFIYEYSKRKILDSSAFGKDSWHWIQTAITKAREAEMERIHQAFIVAYKGAGEVFFPYVSEDNCTKEEELEAVEREWKELLTQDK